MSDKVVFRDFVDRVAVVQLLLFSRGILSRGGIAHGKHSQDDDIIFSQALVEAYRLESVTAQFPRTVVSEDLLMLFGSDGLCLAKDRDGMTFVDYLRSMDMHDVQECFHRICDSPGATNQRVKAKVSWLRGYISERFLEVQGLDEKMIFH